MTYVLGDVHGRALPYHRMLDFINFSDSDTLYVLGDMIDRNPDGIRLLKEVMDAKNIHMLLGNHEHMMLHAIEAPKGTCCNGRDTNRTLWYYNKGKITEEKFREEPEEVQKKILDFIRNLPVNIPIENNGRKILLIHGSPLEWAKQLHYALEMYGEDPVAFAVWDRIYAYTKNPDVPYDLVLAGHTPTVQYQNNDPMEFYKDGKFMFLDCGCAYGNQFHGQLGCLCLETMEEFYVPCEEGNMKFLHKQRGK